MFSWPHKLKVGNISKVVRHKRRLNQSNAKLLSHKTSTGILDTPIGLKDQVEAYLYVRGTIAGETAETKHSYNLQQLIKI